MEEELLYKYFKGTASEEEEKLILNWVDASPENRKAFQKNGCYMTSLCSRMKNK